MKIARPTLSEIFAVTSFIASVLIVCLHAGLSFLGFVHVAVPWFFFASGVFLARHTCKPGWWWYEAKKRFRTVLLPFYIWSSVWVLMLCVIQIGALFVNYKPTNPDEFSVLRIDIVLKALGVYPGRCLGPYWFLRTLYCFVMILPLIFVRSRWIRICEIVVLFIVWMVARTLVPHGTPLWEFFEYCVSLKGLFFFMTGMYLSRYLPLGDSKGARGGVLSCAFPIFLLHYNFIFAFACVANILGVRATSLTSMPWCICRTAFSVMGSLAIAFVLKRFLPSVARIVFGGR